MILTSGTTGTPKGAPRSEAGIDAAVSLLSRMPLRYGWRTHIAAPLFHTWGFAHLALAMLLGSTMVLRRRFDPEDVPARVAEDERCDSLVVIPVMLQRILALPEETLDALRPRPAVKVVAASGSALPGDLALEWMDRFGDNLYNIYGSTEVAYATIATPEDLRAAPGIGRQAAVRHRREDPRRRRRGACRRGSPAGSSSATALLFEGYTGGGDKEVVDGLMSTGDVGRFDEDGRLLRRGPRRRDDRLRWRERLPQGGRGLPRRATTPSSRSPRRRRRRGVRQAAAGVRRAAATAPRRRGRPQGAASRRTSPATRCRARSSSSTSCRATRPARCSSGSSPTRLTAPVTAPASDRIDAMTGLELGGPAPDFTLRDQFGQDVTLSSYRGKKAVAILFYPFAFSGVCTGEMAGVRDRLDEFLTFETEVLAISCDPIYSLRAFADADGLNFPLLSDFWPHGEVARAYGVFDEARAARGARRTSSTRTGMVRWAVHNAMPEGRDLDDRRPTSPRSTRGAEATQDTRRRDPQVTTSRRCAA